MATRDRRKRQLLAKVVLAVTAPVVCLALLELTLALGGVAPPAATHDSLVGFAGNVPLFVAETTSDGGEWLVTSDAKLELFNPQRFPKRKEPGTFRIFCLGGSTTYGRPFDDVTSYPGWLRLLLPRLDSTQRWEVINVGGISYASYRVAALLEELRRYEPDLFIVYTGHNEFLEERTYSSIRDLPGPVRDLSAALARTRISTAMGGLMRRAGLLSDLDSSERFLLPEAVAAKLDRSAGLALYERDDPLRDRILEHYRASLERMVTIAHSSAAELLFVTPASNLRSSSPFKSQHSAGLTVEQSIRVEQLLKVGRDQNRQGDSAAALQALDEGLEMDPRFADLHYERGRALFGLERFDEAKEAFVRSSDEDVCPLRALSRMQEILGVVSKRSGTHVVDFVALLERDLESNEGHTILGAEDFLDHVHPTIDGHRRLAIALAESMRQEGMLPSTAVLSAEILDDVTERVQAGVDREKQAEALASLAWTLDWAGKREDSRRLAFKALESGVETTRVLLIAGKHAALDGNIEQARDLYRRAVRADPLSPTPHYQMGLLEISRGELEAAAAEFALATVLWPHDAKAHEKFGLVMAERGRFGIAVASLREAKRRDPGRATIDEMLARIERHAGAAFASVGEGRLEIERYASGVVRVAAMSWPDGSGGSRRAGIRTEWRENGALQRFADTVNGSVDGSETVWDDSGAAVAPAVGPIR